MTYFDTSALIKVYVNEAESPVALRVILAAPRPVFLSPLQNVELRTALRLKAARGEITVAEQSQAFSAFDADLQSGFFEAPLVVNWPSIFARMESISQQFAAATFCRTLDILHIATALEQGMTEVCSFDGRQRDLAQRCGLTVVP